MGEPGGTIAECRNNPWLDLVRSVAILLVLFRHGERALNAETGASQGVLQTIAMNGWVGVDLFLVLSGYLIARHLLRAGIGSGSFRPGRYLAMRALRIVPAYYAALLLVVVGAFPLYRVDPEMLDFRIFYHLLFMQDYLPSDINVVFWSLGVEEKFYLLAPILVFALMRCRSTWLLLALLLMLFALPILFRASVYVSMGTDMTYPQFWRIFRSPFHMALEGLLIGVAIAVVQSQGFVRASPRMGLAVFAVATAALAAWLGAYDFLAEVGPADVLVQPPLIALLAGLMVVGAVQLAGAPMPLTRPFQFLSRLSYSLYLIHFPLLPMALAIARLSGPLAFWMFYLSASLCAALLLHFAVERPFLLWKDALGRGDRDSQSLAAGGPEPDRHAFRRPGAA